MKAKFGYQEISALFCFAGYREDDYYDNKVEYDATNNVAVPANTGSQRLMQSNEDVNKSPNSCSPTPTPDSEPDFNPCEFLKEARKDKNESEAAFEAHRCVPPEQRKEKAEHAKQVQEAVHAAGIRLNTYGLETLDETVTNAIRYINGTSIAENREYAGQIYKTPQMVHTIFLPK